MKKTKSKKSSKITKKLVNRATTKLPKVEPKIKPLGSRVLIRPFTKEELEKRNSFGIILPSQNSEEKSEQGVVVAVGPGQYQDGKFLSVSLNVGDKVAFSKYGFEEIKSENDEFYLIKEENILAVLK